MRFISRYESPLGRLTLASDGDALTGLWFAGQKYDAAGLSEDAQEAELPVFTETKAWLDAYFDGRKPQQLPPIRWYGSEFQTEVWDLLLEIHTVRP